MLPSDLLPGNFRSFLSAFFVSMCQGGRAEGKERGGGEREAEQPLKPLDQIAKDLLQNAVHSMIFNERSTPFSGEQERAPGREQERAPGREQERAPGREQERAPELPQCARVVPLLERGRQLPG